MKVAWIVPGFSSDERDWCIPALLDLARVMAQRCELHVVALQYPYRRDTYRIGEATVHSIGGANRGRASLPLTWFNAARVMDRLRADVVHAFWAYEPGVIAARLRRRAVRIISLAGGELVDLPNVDYGLFGRRRVRWLMQPSLRRVDYITAGSLGLLEMARKVIDVDPARFAFAPLGVDVEMFSPETQHREMPSLVLNVGSLLPVKGQGDLIRAFRFVVDRKPEARLVIVGMGPLREELGSVVHRLDLAERVSFAGEIPHERLPGLYRSAALFVQASLHEAQGMAVLEAAACGLPIVGTPVGALADLAPDAAVLTSGDPIRMAQAILSVLGDASWRRTLGQSARARVEHEYSLAAAADRFEELYRRPPPPRLM